MADSTKVHLFLKKIYLQLTQFDGIFSFCYLENQLNCVN